MRRILPAVLLLAALPAMAGCGPRALLAFGTGAVVGAAIASTPRERVVVYEPAPVYVVEPSYVYVPPPPPPERERPPAPPPPTFDAAAAREALGATDLSMCKDLGAPKGYGHARVTFAEAGNVTKVVVDAPRGLSSEAVNCIGLTLGTAHIRSFDGPATTVGTTWLIH